MKIKRICVGIIIALLGLMVFVGCQMEPAAEVTPQPTAKTVAERTLLLPDSVDGQGREHYSVSSLDEFIAAIGSNRVINLAPGSYDLSTAESYGSGSGEYWYWNECYDGYELVISGAEKLSITGGGTGTEILTGPRYANVLKLINCAETSLEGLTLGHWPDSGSCSGGVVYLEGCEDISIVDSELYGCGIIGITAINCKRVHAEKSDIYDCSQNAVFSSSCYDLRLTDCKIYNNGSDWVQGMFYTEGSKGFALINCEIYENCSGALLHSSYSQQVSVLGCTVHDNSFSEALINADGYAVTIDKCSFEANGCTETYRQLPALSPDGRELEWADFEQMQQAAAEYSGPVEARPVSLDESLSDDGRRQVNVSTVDEFLAAIGSDTVIVLSEGVYDLSTAADYGAYGNDSYYWVNVFDGPGLVIKGVQNLSIRGEGDVTIAAIPRYANVISFVNCENISLSGFTAGHTEAPGECAGGVLQFENCWGLDIDDCRLYGCGIWGIMAYYCSELDVKNTEIYDCSVCAIALYTVMDASFENMNVHDCGSPELCLTDSMDTCYEGQELGNGDYMLQPEDIMQFYVQR